MVLILGNEPDVITYLDANLGGMMSIPSWLSWNYPIAPAYYLGIRSISSTNYWALRTVAEQSCEFVIAQRHPERNACLIIVWLILARRYHHAQLIKYKTAILINETDSLIEVFVFHTRKQRRKNFFEVNQFVKKIHVWIFTFCDRCLPSTFIKNKFKQKGLKIKNHHLNL